MVKPTCVFGIKYSYSELKHLKEREDYIKCAEENGDDDLSGVLTTLFDCYKVKFHLSFEFDDDEAMDYYLGCKVTKDIKMDLCEFLLKSITSEYNIKYEDPDVYNFMTFD